MKKIFCFFSILIALLSFSCHDAGSRLIVTPKSISENIPPFFWLVHRGNNFVETSPVISHYVDVILEEAGSTDTIDAEQYRVTEDYSGPCQYDFSYSFDDSVESRYCIPLYPPAQVLIFESGEIGMFYNYSSADQ